MFVAIDTDASGPLEGGRVGAAYGPFTTNEKAVEFAHQHALVTGDLDPADDVDGRGDLQEDLTEMGWVFTEVEFVDEDNPDFTPLATFHATFGPGKLESIHLYKYEDGSAQVLGSYRIYCGMGNEHTFAVDSGREDPEAIEALTEIVSRPARISARHYGVDPTTTNYDQAENFDLAEAMVEEVIEEEWSDPCDEAEGEGLVLQPKTFDINDEAPEFERNPFLD